MMQMALSEGAWVRVSAFAVASAKYRTPPEIWLDQFRFNENPAIFSGKSDVD
jgi:hypothetical protein